MDTQTAQHLTDLTRDFYARVHDSFSLTRSAAWAGWERVADVCGIRPGQRLDVLDLACGNLRLERFLADKGVDVRAWCVDACDELAVAGGLVGGDAGGFVTGGSGDPRARADGLRPGPRIHYQHADLTRELALVEAPPCDLCACFGFMHHLPRAKQRLAVLLSLVGHARPGGFVAVSFWQFERDRRIIGKARPLPTQGDYLLGWQGQSDVARYCHSFSESEIDELVARVGTRAREVARFSADGRRGDLNRYLVLRVPVASGERECGTSEPHSALADKPRGAGEPERADGDIRADEPGRAARTVRDDKNDCPDPRREP